MTNSEKFYDQPGIIVDPTLKNYGVKGHITADNRSRDNTVTIELISSDPKVSDLKMNLDVGTSVRPPQVIAMSYQMLSLGIYDQTLKLHWRALSAIRKSYESLPSEEKEQLSLLVHRFRALLEQTQGDTDVDVLRTPDPKSVYKLLQLRNVVRGICHLEKITDFPNSVLPPWENKQTAGKV